MIALWSLITHFAHRSTRFLFIISMDLHVRSLRLGPLLPRDASVGDVARLLCSLCRFMPSDIELLYVLSCECRAPRPLRTVKRRPSINSVHTPQTCLLRWFCRVCQSRSRKWIPLFLCRRIGRSLDRSIVVFELLMG